jgi:hypothetical protein
MPGYDFETSTAAGDLISRREPRGNHGYDPQRASMTTIMVFNGPGVAPKRKLSGIKLIDFAPTLSKLMRIPAPLQSSGRILEDALAR